MAELRQRGKANNDADPSVSSKAPAASVTTTKNGLGVTDVLRILGGLFLLNSAISYFVTNESIAWGWRPWFSKPTQVKQWLAGPVRLTDTQLSAYDGTDATKPIYLALNGTIYDVSAGRHAYGPGGSYSFFAGRDATRAFITGCFDSDLTPDLRGVEVMYVPREDAEPEKDKELSKAELKTRREREVRLAKKKVVDTVEGWAQMFRGEGGKNYFKVGEVLREEGWLEKMPYPELCERAKKQRPKRKADGKGKK